MLQFRSAKRGWQLISGIKAGVSELVAIIATVLTRLMRQTICSHAVFSDFSSTAGTYARDLPVTPRTRLTDYTSLNFSAWPSALRKVFCAHGVFLQETSGSTRSVFQADVGT